MYRGRFLNLLLDVDQVSVRSRQIDLDFRLRRADIASDVQVEIVGRDFVHFHASGVAPDDLRTPLVGVDDLPDMFV